MLFSQEKIKERINQNLILENNRSRQHVKQQLCDKPRHRLNDKRKLETKKKKRNQGLKHLYHNKSNIDDSYSSDSSSPVSLSLRQVQLSNSNIIHHCSTREDLGIFSSEEEDLSLIDTKDVLEENIGKEIERILIEIYNFYITSPESNSNKHIIKTEDHFELFCRSLKELPNLIILQILTEKIKGSIRKYKELMFEVPEIRLIKEKYEEMKRKQDEAQNNKSNGKTKIKTVIKDNCALILPPLPTLKRKSDKSSCENEHHAVNALLLYLKHIKEALINSSAEIERKFRYSMGFAKNSTDKKFSFEEIHKEEMNNVIIHDELISLLLNQIKSLIKEHKQSNIRDLINYIEDKLNESKGMSEICVFLIKRITEIQEKEKQKPEYHINNNENFFFSTTPSLRDTRTQSISASTSATEDNMKPKEDEKKEYELDIDELVIYISGNNQQKKAKKNKKHKKKKNANPSNKYNSNSPNTNNNTSNVPQNDQLIIKQNANEEVESFKQSIRQNCYISYTVNKIKPTLSSEWLQKIAIK